MAEETKRDFYKRTHQDGQNSGREVTNGRVDHPEGKYKYISESDPEVQAPDTTGRVTRPSKTGQVTRPANNGKVTRPEGTPVYQVSDTSTVNSFFSVHVPEAGEHQEAVADAVLGEKSRKSGRYDLTGGYSVQFQKADAYDKAMGAASRAILLGAKVHVEKNLIITSDFVHLEKGTPVNDQGEVRIWYFLTVNAWGDHKSQVMDILFGADRNPNLDAALPVNLTYKEADKEQVFALADRLLDAGADFTLRKQVAVDVALY